jgi:hypothetical protein
VQEKISFCPRASALRDSWEATAQTAHLQTAQANTQPKFAKELFFAFARCQWKGFPYF